MALSLRLAGHRPVALSALLGRSAARAPVLKAPRANCATSERVRAVAEKEMNAYWTKNYQLGRPWSPHLTVYKAELPMITSLAHRATGIGMTLAWTGIGIAAFWFTGHYTEMIDWLRSTELGPILLTTGKFIMAWPPCWHVMNGVRHLAWDYAMGFSLTATYRSGYLVLALSLGLAAYLATLTLEGDQKKKVEA